MAQQPEFIQRYRIDRILGKGGMGVVYLAHDPDLDRPVAIKLLKDLDRDDLRERFSREARAVAKLAHINIVTIFELGNHEGQPFIAMEYLHGETVADRIRRQPPLELGQKLQLMEGLCAGLGYAHRQRIIHRDIKPANLVIAADGALKILDFGLARLTSDASMSGLTVSGALHGTPHYMSPEQAEGHSVDHRSDIFACGLVLYELLASRKAFTADTPLGVLRMIVQNTPPPLEGLGLQLPPELIAIVNKALNKRPADRYKDLETMGFALATVRSQVAADEARARVRAIAVKVDAAQRDLASGALESSLAAANEALKMDAEHTLAGAIKAKVLEAIEARRIKELDRARKLTASARALFDAGNRDGAFAMLAEESTPHELVSQCLADLRRESAEQERRRVEQERLANETKARLAGEQFVAALQAFRVGDFERSVAACERTLEIEPRHEEALVLIGKARTSVAEREGRARIAEARAHVLGGDLEAASEVLDQAVSLLVAAHRPELDVQVEGLRREVAEAREKGRVIDEAVGAAEHHSNERVLESPVNPSQSLRERPQGAESQRAEQERAPDEPVDLVITNDSPIAEEGGPRLSLRQGDILPSLGSHEVADLSDSTVPFLGGQDVNAAGAAVMRGDVVEPTEPGTLDAHRESDFRPSPTTRPVGWRGVSAGAAALTLLALGVGVWFVDRARSQPDELRATELVPTTKAADGPSPLVGDESAGMLTMNALPWAEVVTVVDDRGQSQDLKRPTYTPIGMSVPAGKYRVTFKGPTQVVREVVVEVPPGGSQSAFTEFEKVDADEYFRTQGWQETR